MQYLARGNVQGIASSVLYVWVGPRKLGANCRRSERDSLGGTGCHLVIHKKRSPGSGRTNDGNMGYDKEEEKNKKEEKERALKERIIAGVKAHNNYRNKYLGALPQWLKKLCDRASFRDIITQDRVGSGRLWDRASQTVVQKGWGSLGLRGGQEE